MPERTFSYETAPRGPMIALGAFVACAALVPSTIVLVQALTWSAGDAPLPTSPASIIPGLMLALWGGWLATHHERVTVAQNARSLTWVSYAFGLRLRSVSWQAQDIQQIRVAPNAGVKPRGYHAQVCGPRGTRSLLRYFHGSYPPSSVRDTAHLLGIEIETRR